MNYRIEKTFSDDTCTEYSVYTDNICMGYYVVYSEYIEVYHMPSIDLDDFTMINDVYTETDAVDLILESFSMYDDDPT
jgi:hypothetical protein